MRPTTLINASKHGFALVVVLFSLAILTLMFSAASTRTLAGLQFNAGEVVVSDRFDERIEILDALKTLGRPEEDRLSWAGREIRLQSVGGLVDLNTASPEILERLITGYELSATDIASALQNYRTWRRQGYRLQRVSDFSRVTGIETEKLPNLKSLATVHSGRAVLSSEQMPTELLAHLTGGQDSRDIMISLLPPNLLGPATSANFAVFDGNARIGVIGFGPFQDLHKILAID